MDGNEVTKKEEKASISALNNSSKGGYEVRITSSFFVNRKIFDCQPTLSISTALTEIYHDIIREIDSKRRLVSNLAGEERRLTQYGNV